MKADLFRDLDPKIIDNKGLREPQIEAYKATVDFLKSGNTVRELGIILPVGCGKSGCIAILPFAFRSKRTLVVAPNVKIAQQLAADFDPTKPKYFYKKFDIITKAPFPEPVEIRGDSVNKSDLDEADVVITNIQQLQGNANRWLEILPSDYFDLILFDEGHHSVAATWENLKSKFPSSYIVNLSATPLRSDGQIMAGSIIYTFPIAKAIQAGYVKRLKAIVLNPAKLKYVRSQDGNEIEVSLEEVIRLGEDDSDFRRSIVTSKETLFTIVDASIHELNRIRKETGHSGHKIIASALNFSHCHQIVQAYRSRGLRADFIHSLADSKENEKVFKRLENNDIDVIVQVRKLGEGFDHPDLSVAAIFSIFRSLSPFVQFVGRIMRVIKQNDPLHLLNQGTVVFHAGGNIASRWSDFQQFSEADQEYFEQLLPLESLDFTSSDEITIDPSFVRVNSNGDQIEIKEQTGVSVSEIPLIEENPEALDALRRLLGMGYSPEQVKNAMMDLEPIPTTKVRERQSARLALDAKIKTKAGEILFGKGLKPMGRELDKQRLDRPNLIVLKSAIDKKVNAFIGKGVNERSDFTKRELDDIESKLEELVREATIEVFNGKA
ncbi:DEAD/DEAH box helicase [Leptospira sp. WS58.C1]|uniref:DEAD/DEAH box helicase n=1 Tax=Leptospira cinconiae TaxID=3235173 RepID=UPI00349EBA78